MVAARPAFAEAGFGSNSARRARLIAVGTIA